MEALSLIANIIPIVTTAAKVVQTLETIARLRHAPPPLLRLLNEVSDFRIVIVTVQDQLQGQEQDLALVQHLHGLIAIAAQILSEIDEINKDRLTRHLEDQSLESLVLAWGFWLRKHRNLEDLSNRMQQVRVNIANALTLLTASEIPRLRITLQDISLHYHQMSNDMKSLETNISTLRPSIGTLQGMLQNMHSAPAPNPPHPLLRSLKAPPEEVPRTSATMFRIQTAVDRVTCNSLCTCHCHRNTQISSPPWLKGLIGLLFISYNASPLFGQNPCSEKLCRRNSISTKKDRLLKANYYFPTWLLSRMISLRDQWTPRDSHAISVRTPRVVQDPLYFVPIMTNQLFQLQMMFARHETSPFDVDRTGTSALMKAVDLQRVDICQFLLNEHADPHLEDQFSQSPIDYIFHHALIAPENSDIQAIYRMCLPFIDADELLQRKRFNPIHQVVLGFRPGLSLEEFLAVSTAGIDGKDGKGWSPLFWAVRRSNLAATHTLLNYGASIESTDPKGYNIFHVVMRASKNRTAMLKLLLNSSTTDDSIDHQPLSSHDEGKQNPTAATSNIDNSKNPTISKLLNAQAFDGMTPLSLAAYKNLTPETELLLSHHASPDLGRPLTLSIQVNSHSITRLLLSWGAATDVRDSENMTMVHVAACFADLEMLGILRDWCLSGKNGRKGLGLDLNGKEVDKWNRTAKECFEQVRAGFVAEELEERRRCEGVFLELLDALTTTGGNESNSEMESSIWRIEKVVGKGYYDGIFGRVGDYYEREAEDRSVEEDEDEIFYDAMNI